MTTAAAAAANTTSTRKACQSAPPSSESVPAAASRLKEAAALGFRTVYLPSGNAAEAAAFPDVACRPVDRVSAFLAELFRKS